MTKLVLKVKGMHCASCSTLIDKLIGKQPGVVLKDDIDGQVFECNCDDPLYCRID